MRHRFAKTIEGAAFDEAAVGDESQHAVVAQAVARPAEKARIHVVEFGLLRVAFGDVGVLDALVDFGIFAVLVVVVFVGLIGVVRRVADDDADAFAVLAFDACNVFLADAAENIRRRASRGGVQADIVQRVHKTQIGEFLVLPADGGIGGLDVQIGDVIRQDGDFVGVQLVEIFMLELGGLAAKMFQQFADEGSGASGRIEDVHVFVDQVFAKVFFGEPVRAVYHKAHDLVRRVHHTQAVGGLGVIDFVKVFVDDFEEGLLLAVAADLRGGGAYRGVIRFQTFERLLLQASGKKFVFQRVQFTSDVVVLVEVAVVKHLGENLFGEDVLDKHLAHIGIGEIRIDRLLRMGEELFLRFAKARVGFVLQRDHLAQGLQHGGQIGFELFHRRAKTRDLGTFKTEKKFEQFRQRLRVGHVAAQHLVAVLPQHGNRIIGKDDVVLRITLLEFFVDLLFEIIALVFGFPISQLHTQLMQQRAIHHDVGFGRCLERIFGEKNQIVLLAPRLEQILERLAHDGLARAAADLFDQVELLEIFVNQELAHAIARFDFSRWSIEQLRMYRNKRL